MNLVGVGVEKRGELRGDNRCGDRLKEWSELLAELEGGLAGAPCPHPLLERGDEMR